MQQRYYDPIAGRFLSVDPIVTDANTGAGFGLYTYVDNNPYAKIDPDGREPKMGECGYIAALCTTVDFAQSAGRYLRDVGTSMRETSGEISFLSVPAETRESAGYRHHQAFAKAFEPVVQILGALGYGNGLPGSMAAGPLAFATNGVLPELQISASKYPQLAANIANAQKAGHPSVLTHGGNAAANRAAALDSVPNIKGLSRDEYPFASSMQGGQGSWVGHVPASQQNAQGALIRNFLQQYGIKPGNQYSVIVVP